MKNHPKLSVSIQTAKVNFCRKKKRRIKMEVVKRQGMTLISAYRSKKQSHLLEFFKEVSCCILNSKVPLEDGIHLSTFPGCGIRVLGMGE